MRASEDEDDEKGEAEEEEEDEMEEEDPWRGVEAATMVACASNRLRWLRAAADRPPSKNGWVVVWGQAVLSCCCTAVRMKCGGTTRRPPERRRRKVRLVASVRS